jgi:hypothetical protein
MASLEVDKGIMGSSEVGKVTMANSEVGKVTMVNSEVGKETMVNSEPLDTVSIQMIRIKVMEKIHLNLHILLVALINSQDSFQTCPRAD